ncbi:hypothetical protein F1D05_22745 [Kribbella qitaiheensis]|uniref:Uncharacterized protein n=1 Tax=Kribbella qitaiheensis TaxID=1544730 RepID=A0A7G6X1U5_9ACTN|nr:hypothetical protein F1D05_22745 [Kribbella qitaiheensis]
MARAASRRGRPALRCWEGAGNFCAHRPVAAQHRSRRSPRPGTRGRTRAYRAARGPAASGPRLSDGSTSRRAVGCGGRVRRPAGRPPLAWRGVAWRWRWRGVAWLGVGWGVGDKWCGSGVAGARGSGRCVGGHPQMVGWVVEGWSGWGRLGVWGCPQAVDKGVHKVWRRLGRLIGFRRYGGSRWGCPGDRIGSGQPKAGRSRCLTVAGRRVAGASTCPSCSRRRRRCRAS